MDRHLLIRNIGSNIRNLYTAVVDGIGNAVYGALTHKNGATEQSNFNNYRQTTI